MKSLKILLSFLISLAFILGVTEQSNAQDEARGEAVQMYNDAQDLASSNEYDSAIELYREVLDFSRDNQLDDIVGLVEERLPRVYMAKASGDYSTYQSERNISSANRALDSFKLAKEAGDEFGDNDVSQRAGNAIPQLYYVRSVLQYRGNNYDEALDDLNTAIDLNENYAAAYYQKGIVLKAVDGSDVDGFMEWYDKAIEVAERVNDTRTLNSARNGARDELIFRAVNLTEERRFSDAIELLNRVEQYDSSSYEAQYRLAEIANERGNWSTAETHARRALELHTGGVANRAKIYFELGTSLKGQGSVEAACSAFENARHGDFTEPANHELQFELKCEGHTPTGR